MGNNKNSNKSFLSEQIRKSDTVINIEQSKQRNNNNDNESFLSKQYENADMEACMQETEKGKQKKRKNNLKVYISGNNIFSNEQETIDNSKPVRLLIKDMMMVKNMIERKTKLIIT